MPATARVRLTRQAVRRFREQEAWHLARDPRVAVRFGRDVERVLAMLAEHLGAGRQVPGKRSRFCVTSRYRFRIVHRIVADEVVILTIFHPRQSGP